MVKKLNIIVLNVALAAASTLLWTGCKDDFLEAKKDYSRLTSQIYDSREGAIRRVDDLYKTMLPQASNMNIQTQYICPSSGLNNDVMMQTTEEFSSFSEWIDPDRLASDAPDFDGIYIELKVDRSPYGSIRNCNDVIRGITEGAMPEEDKPELLGQAYFFRAWQYFMMVRQYGGVAIIDHIQAADVSQASDLAVPRSTTKECIDWICAEFEKAAELLPRSWASDFGRVTKGAALAMAGRARLLYASPLFNRADDKDRWQLAYNAFKKAELELQGVNELVNWGYEPNGGAFARMFSDYNSREMIFGTLYNQARNDGSSENVNKNNPKEAAMRANDGASAGGGSNTTNIMVDLFPMADGKRAQNFRHGTWTKDGGPYAEGGWETGTSVHSYDASIPWLNRDPRFYRTFAFPGFRWRYDGDMTALTDKAPHMMYSGNDFRLWSYFWYRDAAALADINQSGKAGDMLGGTGVYIRKGCNDFDLQNPSPRRYLMHANTVSFSNSGSFFGESSMPQMEYRYAEFMLDLAEAACGIEQYGEAVDLLVKIRERAGYERGVAEASFAEVAGDRGKLFGAIMYERQIELAYEGKRFHDMRRWLLWDGGQNFGEVAGAPSTWTLSGFGGNTCTYIGVAPFNGARRDRVQFAVRDRFAEDADAADPLKDLRPNDVLDLSKEFTHPDNIAAIDALTNFYRTYLVRKETRADPEKEKILQYLKFHPRYYILGLKSNAQNANRSWPQTIGWLDVLNGSQPGTFDPLAE